MKIKKKNLIWIYGTLKDKNRPDNYYVKGRLYNIGPFPAIVLGGDKKIPGQVALVTDSKLESLDMYEGVPDLYTREKTQAYSFEGDEAFDVWVYQWAGSTDNYEEIDKW